MTKCACLAVGLLLLAGCTGLGVKPMPEPLSPEAQQRYEYGWEHLVASVESADRVTLLDTILLAQLWHAGVDRLSLVAEKEVGDVTVVMQSHYLRTAPEEGTFSVAFVAADGTILREEVYAVWEMDDAINLVMTPEDDIENESPEERAVRQARLLEKERRLGAVSALFPEPPTSDEADPAASELTGP